MCTHFSGSYGTDYRYQPTGFHGQIDVLQRVFGLSVCPLGGRIRNDYCVRGRWIRIAVIAVENRTESVHFYCSVSIEISRRVFRSVFDTPVFFFFVQ